MASSRQGPPEIASSRQGPPLAWRDCPKMGKIIVDKFIPFKTPLDSRYDKWVPERYRFGINMLFESLNSNELGMIIDLTNTDRYYDGEEVEARGCQYVKIKCQGQNIPSVELTTKFIQRCAEFINQHPSGLIGVHGTYGFNSTGFLIVSYLVEQLHKSVDAAVELFAQARQPGIFKQDYLDELFRRYTPKAPPEPDWYKGP